MGGGGEGATGREQVRLRQPLPQSGELAVSKRGTNRGVQHGADVVVQTAALNPGRMTNPFKQVVRRTPGHLAHAGTVAGTVAGTAAETAADTVAGTHA